MIWKIIKNFENYEVSEIGEIRNIKTSNIKKLNYVRGYCQIALFKCGIFKTFKVHRLVAEAFIPNPENKEYVNHINGVKTDNFIGNLEWCTASENMKHAHDTGLHSGVKGSTNGNSKLNEEIVLEILKNGKCSSYRILGEKYGISGWIIEDILKGKRWKHVKLD